MTNLEWFRIVHQLITYPKELYNSKNRYLHNKLCNFLRDSMCSRRGEVMTSNQLPQGGKEGFRVYITADEREHQFFEFVRLLDGTYAFRSTIVSPALEFQAVFDFKAMTEETRRFLTIDFDQALEQSLCVPETPAGE